ncbi:MAG: hypothetical protein EBQ80_05025, partial [Proteobacteria bacterium]|nr:hypothetical protein [Pseudomonadota bacterium]
LLSTLSTQNPYQTTPQTTPQSLPNPPQISTISTLSQNSIQATIFNQSSQFIAYPQNITPAGPLPATFTQSPNPTLSGQPATLTLTTSQQATLSFTNQSFSYNLTLPTTLNLPQQTALPATLLTPPQSPPLVLLTATTSTPLPANTSPTTTNIPNNLNVLSILLTGQSLPLPPPNTPLLARVLAAPNTQNQQPILLANGQTATVQLTIENINQNSQLPTGSTLVIEFPTNTPPRILQAIPAGPQNAPANSQTLAQTAAPQGAQTTQALPATGTILQGTIVAQNPVAQNGQSQPQLLLTITSPGPFQGQNLPLTLAQTPPTPLPIGTTLNLQITNNANSLVASLLGFTLPANAQRAHTLTQLSQHWPALQQGLQLLEKSAPQVAQALKNNLPNLANLAPGLLNFTQALAQNSPELAFTQQAATLMRSMGADPTQNLQQLQQLQQRPEDGSWRGTLFPYIENPTDNPRQGGFFWRREESTDPRAPTPTRFIIQLEMSNLGPLQLDGLVAYPQCLLKLRQNTPPSPTFTQQIQELTANLFEQYGLTGGLTVETTKSFPLNPLAEMLAQTENPLPTQA